MRGEFIGIWPELWREVWSKLARHSEHGESLLAELASDLLAAPKPPAPPPAPTELNEDGEIFLQADIEARDTYEHDLREFESERSKFEEAVNGGPSTRDYFRRTLDLQIREERQAIAALEAAYSTIAGYEDPNFSNRYFLLVEAVIQKYSLRYDLRRPFSLHPTLPGVFASLMRELRLVTEQDEALSSAMREFEDAIRDLRGDQTSGRIKTCIHKQMNLLEAIAKRCPGVTGATLGAMCDQVGTWPHATIKEAMKKLYGFSSDYPGIRHAGNPSGQLREIEMRDMVAVSVMLAGFAPYLSDRLNSNGIYSGGGS